MCSSLDLLVARNLFARLITQFAQGMKNAAYDWILQTIKPGLCFAANADHAFPAQHCQVLRNR